MPEPANPQSLNRYSYVYNSPLKYTDPSGHSGLLVVIALAIVLTIPSSEVMYPPAPTTAMRGDRPTQYLGSDCQLSLSDCFGNGTVTLKDFSAYDQNNPLSKQEFHALLDKVAGDLYAHDTPSPGLFAGRSAYDTPFYDGGGRTNLFSTDIEPPEYDSDQQVCIEGLGCSGRSNINYFAQGMWSAASGERFDTAETFAGWWKSFYGKQLNDELLFWLRYGYDYYIEWLKREHGSETDVQWYLEHGSWMHDD